MSTPYDQVHYFSRPFDVTHPARMQTVASVFGHDAPEVSTARVLELGCGSGGNLLPMADAFPQMEVVGVDLAESAVEQGRKAAEQLGLGNVDLRPMNLANLPEEVGRFDYIIAHGVYSWVPPEVRERILEICRDHLTEDGVAYISYNCLPGWNFRGVVRDLALWTGRDIDDPDDKIRAAREAVDFIAEGSAEGSAHRPMWEEEQKFLDKQQDFYFFHDHMSPHNEALTLWEFIRRLRGTGLDYLGDCYLPGMIGLGMSDDVIRILKRVSRDLIEFEQYLDHFRDRAFRRTLVIREGIRLDRHLDWTCLKDLTFSHALRPVAPRPDQEPDEEHWSSVYSDRLSFVTGHPLLKAAMRLIYERPQGIHFQELVSLARAEVGGDPEAGDAEALGTRLFECWLRDTVDATRVSWSYVSTISERPEVIPLSRYFAAHGDPSVTNRKHRSVNVDRLDRRMMVLLDGTRTVDEVLEQVIEDAVAGNFEVSVDGEPITERRHLVSIFTVEVERRLEGFARASLLVG